MRTRVPPSAIVTPDATVLHPFVPRRIAQPLVLDPGLSVMNPREDLLVAATAAVSTVALSLGLRYGFGVDVDPVTALAPIGVYFVYLFTKRTPLARVPPAAWTGLVVAAALAALAVEIS